MVAAAVRPGRGSGENIAPWVRKGSQGAQGFRSPQVDLIMLGSKPQITFAAVCHGESRSSWPFLCLQQKYRQRGVVSNVRSQSGLPHSRTRGLKYGSA